MEKHTTKITSKSIEQSGLPTDYKKAIAEYIWNGFDAKATKIEIEYQNNELGFIESFSIKDNGEGINLESIDETFGWFLDSQKKSSFEKDGFIKGKKGKGRYAFSLFANKAIWETRYKTNDNKYFQYSINIERGNEKDYNIDNKLISHSNQTGTTVFFYDFYALKASQLEAKIFEDFICSEFGWFLFLNKGNNYSISINNNKINYNGIIDDNEEFDKDLSGYNFKISFLRWNKKIGDKYYYYFLNEEKKESDRKHTSFNNKAIDFHHSVYIESVYFNNFKITNDDDQEFSFTDKNQTDLTFKNLIKELNQYVLKKEKQFIRDSQAENLIKDYHKNKIFPIFENNAYGKLRQKDLENIIKELYCIQPNIFQNLKKDPSKTIVGLLNLLLDTDQRENILIIIENIIKLTVEERETFAKSLLKTNLSQITKVISLLVKRFETTQILKALVFDLEKFTTERDHIQIVVEENYWLFGEQYHLVSADENFEKVLNNYMYFFDNGSKPNETIINKKKLQRPDIFICRQSYSADIQNNEYTMEENIIVELKRPSIVIGKEQYSQVEDYLSFIRNLPRFNSQLRKWKFILIGKSIDTYIEGKYKSQKLQGKRFLVEAIDNFEIYAMTWDDVFKTFEGRHKHLIDKLEYKESIIEELNNRGYSFNRNMSDELTKIAVNQ